MGFTHVKKRIFQFILDLIDKSRKDQLLFLSNWLTYRVLVAFFPFMFFLVSLLGYLNLDTVVIMVGLHGIFPEDVYRMLETFFTESATTRSHALLSTSILFVLISSINGFRAVVRSVNNAYDVEDGRGIFMQALLSIVLMLIFTIAIIVMLVLLIFGGQLRTLLPVYTPDSDSLFIIIRTAISLIVLTIVIMLIYKLSCAKRLKMRNVLPGAVFTILSWVISSAIFGYFISHFSNMSAIYGSIAGIFILMLWLNLITLILLLGNEINALLYKSKSSSAT